MKSTHIILFIIIMFACIFLKGNAVNAHDGCGTASLRKNVLPKNYEDTPEWNKKVYRRKMKRKYRGKKVNILVCNNTKEQNKYIRRVIKNTKIPVNFKVTLRKRCSNRNSYNITIDNHPTRFSGNRWIGLAIPVRGGKRCEIKLNHGDSNFANPGTKEFKTLIEHEILHCFGAPHAQKTDAGYPVLYPRLIIGGQELLYIDYFNSYIYRPWFRL